MATFVTAIGILFSLDFVAFEHLGFYSLLISSFRMFYSLLIFQLSNVLLSVYVLLMTLIYLLCLNSGCGKQVGVAKYGLSTGKRGPKQFYSIH